MKINITDLTKKFSQEKYPISTGSIEWQELKTDYELEDDAVAGTSMYQDYNKIGTEKIKNLKSGLEQFKTRLKMYVPKDELEIKEKETVENKVNIGLRIYEEILLELN